jgi:hypothetical protein
MAATTEGSVTFRGYQILGARAGGSSVGHRRSPSSSQGRTVHTVSSPAPSRASCVDTMLTVAPPGRGRIGRWTVGVAGLG